MIRMELVAPLAVGLFVWFGTYFPLRRMLSSIVDDYAQALSLGLSAMLGVAALTAWRQEVAYRFAVLGICLLFIGIYVVAAIRERISKTSR